MKDFYAEEYRNLYKQVIKRAIKDCMVKKEMLARGKSWMEELVTDPEYYLFDSEEEALPSFIGICSLFECDPDYLRGAIRDYLEEKRVEVGQSALEQLRAKLKREKLVVRNRLNIWAWGRLRLKKKGLDELLDILLEEKVINEFTQPTPTGRLARYYVWIDRRR